MKKFKTGDRVRLSKTGPYLEGTMGIIISTYDASETYDYYVKAFKNLGVTPFKSDDLEFIAHAPNSLDDVTNDEWNASQAK